MSLRTEALLEHLLLQGAIQVSGFDQQTGETLYDITDKLQEVAPEMYDDINKTFRENMYRMIDKGPKIMTWRINLE
jgi:hypothetical protein